MRFACLAPQQFDSQAFGHDYYRVVRFEYPALQEELAALRPPFMVDAKRPAQDIEGAKALLRLGFTKACVQPTFVLDLAETRGAAVGEPFGKHPMDTDELEAHAANFLFTRFGLDPSVTERERVHHQRLWIGNSMASTEILKFVEPGAFVSFRVKDGAAAIDLVSVLPEARGRGSLLLGRLRAWAASKGLGRIEVTTESENITACLFYQKNGYRLDRAAVAFHLRRLDGDGKRESRAGKLAHCHEVRLEADKKLPLIAASKSRNTA